MRDFTYENGTRIVFGHGAELELSALIERVGAHRVLLHYGQESIKQSGLYDVLYAQLEMACVMVVELPGALPNPRLSLVREGINICREQGLDFIVAVGGGSVIDSAKAIAMGVHYEGDVWDFFDSDKVPKQSLPVGVVLTVAAAGSETSAGAVLTNEDGSYKRACNEDECVRPKFAILNPELTFTLTARQTAFGAVDMFSHVMERYFTREPNVELSDRLCEATMVAIINNAVKAIKAPDNYEARAELMWAGTIAHGGLLGAGRGGDWASHAIEHELSALYDIPHGAGLAIVLPAWMKQVYAENVSKFAQFATRVMGVEPDFEDLGATALRGIDALEDFFKQLGLATRLSAVGITDDKFEEMSRRVTYDDQWLPGDIHQLSAEVVRKILNTAL